MIDSVAYPIYLLLLSKGKAASTGDWTGYVGFAPDEPDKAVVVYDTAGEDDGRVASGERIVHHGIEILVRGKTYAEARAKITEIAETLDTVKNETVMAASEHGGGSQWMVHAITRRGDVLPVGVEVVSSRRRFVFTLNAIVTARYLGVVEPGGEDQPTPIVGPGQDRPPSEP